MRRLLIRPLLPLFIIAGLAGPVGAYTLLTSVSESCHERLTFEAINVFLADLQSEISLMDVPQDRVTQRLMDLVRPNMPPDITEPALFIAMSILAGVRAPDTEGHSTLDLSALRRVHADPAPDGQYAHALRGPGDDGVAGDLVAIEGTRRIIREQLDLATSYLGPAPAFEAKLGKRNFFVDHYDTVRVPVMLTGYHMGRALHALQDAHAHMVREGDRFEHVVHVTNYVEAVDGTLSARRDGLAHSDALDDCNRADVTPIAAQARLRSAALIQAYDEALQTGTNAPVERGLSPCPDDATRPESCGWIEYRPRCEAALLADNATAQAEHCCTVENDFCADTVPAVGIALQEPSGPYLGCTSTHDPRPRSGGWLWLIALSLWARVRRRRSLASLALMAALGAPAHAEPPQGFIASDGHFASLSDAPRGSILNMAMGYAVRGGYRWGRWRFIGMVERSHWIPVEFEVRVDPGVLNVGVGIEVLLFDDWVRIGYAVGPSILLFDTTFDDAGSVGYFVDFRPGGLRYAVADGWVVTFDPVALSLQQPVLRDPPIRKLHRRFNAGIEFEFL